MDSLQYIKLLALMATTLLGDVLPEGDLDLNSKENPARVLFSTMMAMWASSASYSFSWKVFLVVSTLKRVLGSTV